MNKLLVSNSIDLNNGSYNLVCDSNILNINVEGKVNVYLNNEILNELNINIKNNSILNLYKYNNKKECDLVVNINQLNNSKLNYNEAIINNLKNKLTINNYIKGNNNESNINIRNICNDQDSEVIINVEIDKNTINNVALEDLKGINNGGNITIEPNIICLSNEVVANHLTTIGSIDKHSLEYLMSKGIRLESAKKIILKGFINSNMDENFKKNFGGD